MNVPRDVDKERLVRLEESVAHQEQLLDQLNEALTHLRLDYDALLKHSRNAEVQIQWLLDNSSQGQDPLDEKPPHY
ncbi:MAG: SlyX family protein [Planctomycetota bacterium]|nr:SlyX family protein [Planctomycetota bacterium]